MWDVSLCEIAAQGFKLKMSERSYFPGIDDDGLDLVLFRSQEIPYGGSAW